MKDKTDSLKLMEKNRFIAAGTDKGLANAHNSMKVEGFILKR